MIETTHQQPIGTDVVVHWNLQPGLQNPASSSSAFCSGDPFDQKSWSSRTSQWLGFTVQIAKCSSWYRVWVPRKASWLHVRDRILGSPTASRSVNVPATGLLGSISNLGARNTALKPTLNFTGLFYNANLNSFHDGWFSCTVESAAWKKLRTLWLSIVSRYSYP